MTTLVTGGVGCIGSWVVRRLLAAGEIPLVYDFGGDPCRLTIILRPPPPPPHPPGGRAGPPLSPGPRRRRARERGGHDQRLRGGPRPQGAGDADRVLLLRCGVRSSRALRPRPAER